MNGPRIKAIQTRYKGYHFRSRLEARWAVFLDALGVRWEYEPQGFDLDGFWYLPDFWVPEWNAWIEIKPALDLKGYEGPQRMALALKGSSRVWMIAGNPWPGEMLLVPFPVYIGDECWVTDWSDEANFEQIRGGYDIGGVEYNQFARCRRCDGISLVYADGYGDPYAENPIGKHTCEDHDKFPTSNEYNLLMFAYTSARSARFEHGETPR